MDDVDKKILYELQLDGRKTMRELGKIVGLTAPAATERVKKLEDRGVIKNYTISVDPHKLDKIISAYILFDTDKCKQFVEFCHSCEDVMECHRLAGQYSYLVKIVTSSVASLEQFIDSTMKYGKSSTLIVLSTPIESNVITS
ncbi:Lrp/AsnC family transcriptional regulator [Neobacillus sp. PS3-34]|uniref:Lrp/AsnC family transcriptional regulator n=1 Tax=Neobacillus sp. PS3-34 TaxID=3070678 RepID=UPI0027E04092|nr:Lrp/AsnC family transcriptional regulator [Neobacillus sp. PS3-34]WML48385.1 Lrp/AsnC family transcriptional regulator [Neobacillus sp. PS3-34]